LTETDTYGIPKVDAEETRRVVNLAFDHGINFIDTANRYHGAMAPVDLNHYGNAEKVLSGILKDHERESFVLATKVGNEMAPWPNGRGLSRKHMFWQIAESLKRLRLEYADVYLAHLPDEETPHLETLKAFNDLVTMGKIHYIGCSNFTTEQVTDFMELSKAHDLVSFVTLQDPYSLINRRIESDRLPIVRKYNFTIMAYSALAEGLLSGRYLDGVPAGSRATYSQSLKKELSEKNLESLRKLSTLAREKSISLSQLAIAWIVQKRRKLGVNIIPIIGVSSSEQLRENLQALEVHLSEDDMSRAEQIVLPMQVQL
jgi:aryl-alcohol dehydrogenase-like predicted oxidoreductase